MVDLRREIVVVEVVMTGRMFVGMISFKEITGILDGRDKTYEGEAPVEN